MVSTFKAPLGTIRTFGTKPPMGFLKHVNRQRCTAFFFLSHERSLISSVSVCLAVPKFMLSCISPWFSLVFLALLALLDLLARVFDSCFFSGLDPEQLLH